jgi:hypothetical protein
MLDHPVGATGEHDTITDRIFRRQVKCVQYASLAEQARRFYLRNEAEIDPFEIVKSVRPANGAGWFGGLEAGASGPFF